MKGKSKSKATGKAKAGKGSSLATRVAKRVAGQPSASGGKAAVKSAATKVTVVGSGAKGHTMITAEQLAAQLGVSGKRLRAWLRSDGALGNDHVYTRYGIDIDHAQGKALVVAAKARFGH